MSAERVFNFSAGPAAMPLECLEEAAAEMTNWRKSGMSVIECSHRSKPWGAEMAEAEANLRQILSIPDTFHVLFLAGGASLRFSEVCFNLIGDAKCVDYLCTGTWSSKAMAEATRLAFPGVEVHSVAGKPDANPIDVKDKSTWTVHDDAAYFYYCDNETIQGIEFQQFPDVKPPLVIDMSSNFLSKPITQWDKVGCIFACAQKNFGPAGMTIVVVRKDLLEQRKLKPFCPITLDWRIQVANKCLYNTPPAFPIYFANLVFKWILKKGGIAALQEINRQKAAKVYEAIEKSPHFVNKVKPEWRSVMNIPFFRPDGYEVKNPDLDLKFINFCAERKIQTIKGHVSVGGFRASIYNSCPMEAVDALCKAIEEFPGF